MFTVAGTGHRTNKIDAWPEAGLRRWIRDETKKILVEVAAKRVISGMAVGFDQDLARCATELSIPFTAAVPFKGQEVLWPEHAKKEYFKLLEKAADIVYVSPPGYIPSKMQVRNVWLVEHCDLLIACWDGTSGGTANCVKYAEKVSKPIRRINPDDLRRMRGDL